MGSYYLAPALETLRAEINARWPRRDKASDGWIGDAAHRATRSDHNPNERGSVNALDVDKDGIDIAEVIAAFERHPSAHYWIYNRQIADRDEGWRRRPYTGPNPHDKHGHFSIRQSRTAEQDRRPWGLLEDDMPLNADDLNKVKAAARDAAREALLEVLTTPLALPGHIRTRMTAAGWAPQMEPWTALARLVEALVLGKPPVADVDETQLAAELGKLLPSGHAVTDEQLERVLRRVLGSLDTAQPAS